MTPKTFEELIDFAINEEKQAAAFYTKLAGEVKDANVKEALLGFADQERGHQAKLEAIRDGIAQVKIRENVPDLKISDYMVDVEENADLSFQGALTIAMKKEKAAYRMYMDMAAATDDPKIKETLRFLAQEEAAHKLGFEIEYDEVVFQEH